MSDENTPTTETATNGANGTANGAHHGDPKPAGGGRKKKKHKRHGRPVPAAAETPPAEAAAATETPAAPQEAADNSLLDQLQSEDRLRLTEERGPVTFLDMPPEASAEVAPAQAGAASSAEQEPPAPSAREPSSAEVPHAPPPHKSVDALRLRMKIWTDPKTGKRYLMPAAFMRDVVKGQPVSDAMYAYAMRDDSTKLVTLTAREWNALPFFYFHEDGPAPRATTRPMDVIR